MTAQSPPYRLVATDLDGTLLDARGAVSDAVRRVVADLGAAGVRVVLATSRRATGALPIAEALGLEGPLLLYDGALTRSHPDGAVLAEERLPAALAQVAAELLAAEGLRPIAQHADAAGEYLLLPPPPADETGSARYLALVATQIRTMPLARLCVGQPDPLRVVAFGPVERLRRVAVALTALGCGRQLLLQGNYGTAELSVFARTASKGAALLHLAERLGIPHAATVAIGDGRNDLAMLRVAGLSIAMAHAPRQVRAVADVVAPGAAGEGFVRAMRLHVLGESLPRDAAGM